MKNWTLALALGTAVTTTVIGTANAASAITVSGPGGSGSGGQVGNVITVNESFTGVGPSNYLDKIFNSAAANQTYTYNVNVRNDSGQNWTDFHFQIIGSQAGQQVSFLNPPGSSTVFGTGSGDATTINWVNGTVADDIGSAYDDVSFSFNIATDANFTGSTFTVREYATVPWETDALPVVGSTVLFGLGVWTKRKLSKRGTAEIRADWNTL